MLENFTLFLVSVFANALSAFVGGGAGLFQLPALLFLGATFSVALATHKLASVALGIGASIRHFRSSSLEKRYVLLILLAGLPGVLLGANIVLNIPDRVAHLSLGILTLGLGVYSALKPTLGQQLRLRPLTFSRQWLGVLVLFLIGIVNGSLTSGSGMFVTLWLVRWFGFDYQRAVVYTLVLVGLLWNGVGALTLAMLSSIRWQWIPVLLIGSLIGGYLGAHMSLKQGNKWIKRVFELLAILVGLKLIFVY